MKLFRNSISEIGLNSFEKNWKYFSRLRWILISLAKESVEPQIESIKPKIS